MRSLRTRLIVGATIGITVFLAANGVLIWVLVRARMIGALDAGLAGAVRPAGLQLVQETLRRRAHAEGPAGGGADVPRPRGLEGMVFELWDPGVGESLVRSEGLAPGAIRSPSAIEDELVFRTLELADGRSLRVVGLTFRLPRPPDGRPGPPFGRPRRPGEEPADAGGETAAPRRWVRGRGEPGEGGDARPGEDADGEGEAGRPRRGGARDGRGPAARRDRPVGPFEIAIARDLSEIDATLAHLRWLLLAAWATACVGSAGILSWVVSRGLRPVRSLREQIGAIDEERLDQRFSVSDAPLEIAPVVDQLNGMMGRIQDAFAREQAFAADAAHELRTPLAGIRSTLEVALLRPRANERYVEAATRCLTITGDMQRIVETLLELARSGVEEVVEREPVRVAEVLDALWEAHAAAAAERRLDRRFAIDEGLEVSTHRTLFKRMLANLIENAVSYADEGTTIEVRSEAGAGRVRLAVSNAARGAPAELAERAFDTFWRADASRSSDGRHVGLGLALCRRIAATLGGGIAARTEGDRFVVTVTLPRGG